MTTKKTSFIKLMHEKAFLMLFLALLSISGYSQFLVKPIYDINPVITSPNIAWADYSGDGLLDIAIQGCIVDIMNCAGTGKIYKSTDIAFTQVPIDDWPGGTFHKDGVIWADFNNDEKMDLVMSGDYGVYFYFQNDTGFTDTIADYMYCGDVDTGDFDNDNDLDLLVTGRFGYDYVPFTKILRNDNGFFTDSGISFEPLGNGSCDWGDYDNDGDLDIAYNGLNGDEETLPGVTSKTYILRNDAGTYTNINAALLGLSRGDISWIDYDNDGDLDLSVKGIDFSYLNYPEYSSAWTDIYFKMYENTDGSFVEISTSIPGSTNGSIEWGDFDQDGDDDLLIAGDVDTADGWINDSWAAVYVNESGSFTLLDSVIGLVQVARWGDYEGDGDLDFITYGEIPGGRIFLNSIISFSEQKPNNFGITTYPNPCKDKLIIKNCNLNEVKTEFYNLLGEKMSGFEIIDRQTIDISGFSGGLYIIRVRNKDEIVYSGKIVKD